MTQIVNLATHQEPYVSATELAAYWGVDVRTVRYQIEKGALIAIRVGRQWRIPIATARAYGRMENPVTAPIAAVHESATYK